MPITYPRATAAVESLKLVLFGNPIRYEIELTAMNRFWYRSGELVVGIYQFYTVC
jgi:muramoyltetrapeptide carboxypeptidase